MRGAEGQEFAVTLEALRRVVPLCLDAGLGWARNITGCFLTESTMDASLHLVHRVGSHSSGVYMGDSAMLRTMEEAVLSGNVELVYKNLSPKHYLVIVPVVERDRWVLVLVYLQRKVVLAIDILLKMKLSEAERLSERVLPFLHQRRLIDANSEDITVKVVTRPCKANNLAESAVLTLA